VAFDRITLDQHLGLSRLPAAHEQAGDQHVLFQFERLLERRQGVTVPRISSTIQTLQKSYRDETHETRNSASFQK
jgi:hypothetical protein